LELAKGTSWILERIRIRDSELAGSLEEEAEKLNARLYVRGRPMSTEEEKPTSWERSLERIKKGEERERRAKRG
jgi:hypothetical protein